MIAGYLRWVEVADGMNSDIQDQLAAGLAAHGRWKVRLRAALIERSAGLAEIADGGPEVRAFEEWLETAAPARARASIHYPECRRLQVSFRAAVDELVLLAQAGELVAAERLLSRTGRLAEISAALTRELTVWLLRL